MTRCRPKEAVLIVFDRRIDANDYIVRDMDYIHLAFVDQRFTKTKKNYFWLLPASLSGLRKGFSPNVILGSVKSNNFIQA